MQIKFVPNDRDNPKGKLADVELAFSDGPLAGLKLVGFALWQKGTGYNLTTPSRSYSVNGERRSFALLRPSDPDAQASVNFALRDAIIAAYEAQVQS